jgi:integrase
LTNHLLPVFASKRLDEIDVGAVDAYRRTKVREARLGPTWINKTITRLGQILAVAQKRGLIVQNPVRINARNRKVKSVRPRQTWLEPDQVLALLNAGGELDREAERGLPVRRPVLAALAYDGLRVGEACALRWRHVDLAAGAGGCCSSWQRLKVPLQPAGGASERRRLCPECSKSSGSLRHAANPEREGLRRRSATATAGIGECARRAHSCHWTSSWPSSSSSFPSSETAV